MLTTPPNNSTAPEGEAAAQYQSHQVDWFTRNVMNKALNGLMRLGLSFKGSQVLEHRGRKSGQIYRTPVNLLTLDGVEYLVAPRGETEWVRNVRAADGQLVLILGRRRQVRTAVEVPVGQRAAILRPYLQRWKFEIGMFFDDVTLDSSDQEFEAVGARHPVFALH
ncbi:MAG TPA: nitroreductase/quinone reductase family protein [Acidimicrobiales bacterium]